MEEFRGQPFDYFITVCDDSHESVPVLAGGAGIAALEHR